MGLQFVPVVSECNWKLRYQKQKSEDTGKIHRSQVQYNKHIREHCWICPEEHEKHSSVFALLLEADITLGKVVFSLTATGKKNLWNVIQIR